MPVRMTRPAGELALERVARVVEDPLPATFRRELPPTAQIDPVDHLQSFGVDHRDGIGQALGHEEASPVRRECQGARVVAGGDACEDVTGRGTQVVGQGAVLFAGLNTAGILSSSGLCWTVGTL